MRASRPPPTKGQQHLIGNQDLSGLRFVRCRFETDPEGVVTRESMLRMRVTNLVGIVSRAGQTLGMEYRGCVFRGPANPMIHVFGSRFALNHCCFRTTVFQGGPSHGGRKDNVGESANGADLFIDNPPFEVRAPTSGTGIIPAPGSIQTASFTAHDVFSESAQFLVTFIDMARAKPAQSATVLRHVRHHPPLGGRPIPSVYWYGPGRAYSPLILSDCDFPAGGVFLAGGFDVPVIDLGNHVRGSGGLFSFPTGIIPQTFALRSRLALAGSGAPTEFHGS